MLTKGYCIHGLLSLPRCKEHHIASKCVSVLVCVCVYVGMWGSWAQSLDVMLEIMRPAGIEYTHVDAGTHRLNKTSSLSALFIFTSVINNYKDVNNPRGINSAIPRKHTHPHTPQSYKHG